MEIALISSISTIAFAMVLFVICAFVVYHLFKRLERAETSYKEDKASFIMGTESNGRRIDEISTALGSLQVKHYEGLAKEIEVLHHEFRKLKNELEAERDSNKKWRNKWGASLRRETRDHKEEDEPVNGEDVYPGFPDFPQVAPRPIRKRKIGEPVEPYRP